MLRRVRDTSGSTDQSPKRKRGVSPIPASHRRTRSLTLGALIALCIHVGAPSDVLDQRAAGSVTDPAASDGGILMADKDPNG